MLALMYGPPRHALTGHRFDQAAFGERYHARQCHEHHEEGHADHQYRKPRGECHSRDREDEVNDPGRERQQHEKQRSVGARIEEHAEESA